jgi:WhiB family redox-sensing transcriptional regulator
MAPDWAWQDFANCAGENLVLFFGPDGERQPERDVRELKAKAICHGCPVRRECRDYAEDSRVAGIWGGLSEEDRKRERRRRSRATTRSAA